MVKRKQNYRLMAIAAVMFCCSCVSTTSIIRRANEVFYAGQYDEAVQLLEKELQSRPKNPEIRTFLYRAKLNSYYSHLAKARERLQRDDKPGAREEYQKALDIFPGNTRLKEEMETRLAQTPQKEEKREKITIEPPIQLAVKPDAKFELTITNNPISNIFKVLGKNYNINFIFDREFRDFIHSVEIKNKGFYEILRMLCLIANTQYRVVDPTTVLIYPDQPYKKQLFDLKAIKTFYLSNIRAEDAKKILMPLFTQTSQGVQIQEEPGLNALVVKADIGTLGDIERFLPNIDIPKSEVEINVEIVELNRNLIRSLGAEYGSHLLSIQAATSQPEAGKTTPPLDLSDLRGTNFYMTLPSVALNLLESDENNKIIARPNLRGLDGEKISYMVGDEVPIPQTQYGGIAAGGVTTVPMTTYQYKNVGVEIKITPFIHHNNEITLETELTISFLTGSGFASEFPVLGKREIKAKFRLKENETNLIGGFIRDDIRKSLTGLPVLSRLPILGRLFGSSEDTIRQTDLIFSITPRIIRNLPIRDKNREPIWINMDDNSGGGATMTEPPYSNPNRDRPDTPPPQKPPPSQSSSALVISPPTSRVALNNETEFSVSMQSETPIYSLAVRGNFNGAGEITDIGTEFFDASVKTMKHFSGASFTTGYTFSDPARPLHNSMIVQVKAKFNSRGAYTLTVENAGAIDFKQRNVNISPAVARIEVY